MNLPRSVSRLIALGLVGCNSFLGQPKPPTPETSVYSGTNVILIGNTFGSNGHQFTQIVADKLACLPKGEDALSLTNKDDGSPIFMGLAINKDPECKFTINHLQVIPLTLGDKSILLIAAGPEGCSLTKLENEQTIWGSEITAKQDCGVVEVQLQTYYSRKEIR